MKRTLAVAALATLLMLAPAGAATTYTVDPSHSEVSFQIRHLVSKVRGSFRDFDATIVRDEQNSAASSVTFRIRAASIDTGHERRDKHLRSADFFDVEKHPEIVFQSTAVEKVSDTTYDVTGDLTIHGVTKSVTLPVTFGGEMPAPGGGVAAGFSTAAMIDRLDYGITWNRTLDNGGLLLGDGVAVIIDLSARRQ